MSPKVKRRFHAIIRRSGIRPERALEVGGVMGEGSLLRFPELAGTERYCLNLVAMPSDGEITAVQGNANDMKAFKRDYFDLVLCCSTLEHDKRFWLSVAEMRRVLKPGGRVALAIWRSIDHNPAFVGFAETLDEHLGHDVGAILRSPFGGPQLADLRSMLEEVEFERVRATIGIIPVRFRSRTSTAHPR